MMNSIIDDIKYQFRTGNTVTRIIMLNIAIFIIAALLHAYLVRTPYWEPIQRNIGLSADQGSFLYKPWTFITHMFFHVGFFHVLWNMIGLYAFGRIVGDLLGDKKVLPLYLIAGFSGAIVYIVSSWAMGNSNSIANGASAAVLGLSMVAATIAPDFIIRLMFIGDVKIKYIVAFFIFLDLIGIPSMDNTGGHFGHLGGMLGGFLTIALYKRNIDLIGPLENLFDFISGNRKPKEKTKKYPSKLKVEHRSEQLSKNTTQKGHAPATDNFQERLDSILEKISAVGYEKLSKEEKDFLNKASKQ